MEEEDRREISFRPTKRLFIRSITRDIDLEEAILDLVDNSIDGYIRSGKPSDSRIVIELDESGFRIEDNCGGIEKERVYEEIFRIGPIPDKQESRLGVFGVGLKRAMFKMGQDILIESDDGIDFFSVHLDEDWLDEDELWTTDFHDVGVSRGAPFFRLSIGQLFPGVSEAFGSTVFLNHLRDDIRNVHTFYVGEGLEIVVNDARIGPLDFEFLDDEERQFKVIRKKFDLGEVEGEIIAGFSKEGLVRGKDVQQILGWYVFCNDRIVLSKDTSSRTGFTDDEDGSYHYPQDSRILGLAFLRSEDPEKLPWRTTKGDIDPEDRTYKALQREMRDVTIRLLNLTRAIYSLADPDTDEKIGKSIFKGVNSKSWKDIPMGQDLSIPSVAGVPIEEIRITFTTVSYQVKKDLMRAVKSHMGNTAMSNKSAGLRTFKYYCELEEVDEE